MDAIGAAIGLLNALYLKIQLGSGVNVQFKGYAMPRVRLLISLALKTCSHSVLSGR